MRRDRRIQGQITKAFRRSEHQLLKALRRRKAEVMVSCWFKGIFINVVVEAGLLQVIQVKYSIFDANFNYFTK